MLILQSHCENPSITNVVVSQKFSSCFLLGDASVEHGNDALDHNAANLNTWIHLNDEDICILMHLKAMIQSFTLI